MVSTAFTLGKSLSDTILQKMNSIGAVQRKFITHILLLYLGIRGRLNFLELGRYGDMDEHSYRNNFEKEFDWLAYNIEFIKRNCSDEIILGFDPSYITKSGKHTHGIGYFYSGCSGKYEKGLEIATFAAIDIKQNTAYHLKAIQSQYKSEKSADKDEKLVDQYCNMLEGTITDELKAITKILVADAYFYKQKFVSKSTSLGIELITRLRNDANLKYLYKGKRKTGRGRPRKHGGKVDLNNIDKRRFTKCFGDETHQIYEGIVYSVCLGLNIKIVHVLLKDKNGKQTILVFMSTNLKRDGLTIYKYYKARYQMEFNFRDAKQFTGLEECQARDKEKLNFHFNCSLTSVNIAKAVQRKGYKRDEIINYSISDIKIEMSNKLLLDLFLLKYGLIAYFNKNKSIYMELLNFGKRAA